MSQLTGVRHLRAAIFALLAFSFSVPPALAELPQDVFDGSGLDWCKWEEVHTADSRARVQGGELLLTGQPIPSFGLARVLSQYRLIGDFDVQVDYRRVAGFSGTPGTAFDHLAVAIGLSWSETRYVQLSRSKFQGGEAVSVYNALPGPSNAENLYLSTSGESGSLRLARAGTRLRYLHLTGSTWVEIGSHTVPATPVSVYLATSSSVGGGQTAPPVTAAFDNFRVNSGSTDQADAPSLAPYARRADFAAGGTSENWPAFRYQSATPIDRNLLSRFRAQGMEWMRVGVTTVKKPILDATPPDRWNTLQQDFTTWGSREYAARTLLDAQASGMRLYAYLYFSDQAANWGNQKAPDEWAGKSVDETAVLVEQHAFETATYFKSRGINVEIYEIGNETDIGFVDFVPLRRVAVPPGIDFVNDHEWLRANVWSIQATLFKAAARGLRRAAPEARIALHASSVEVGTGTSFGPAFYQAMRDFGVDHDIAALSHPYAYFDWKLHNYSAGCWFKRLGQIVDRVASPGRPVMIVEASYQADPRRITTPPMPDFPFSPEGQSAWLQAQLGFASRHPSLAGWFYFYPEFYPEIIPPYDELQGGGLMANAAAAQPGLAQYQANLPQSTAPIEPQTGVWAIDSELNGQPGRGFQLDARNGTLVLAFYGYEGVAGRGNFWISTGPLVNRRYEGMLFGYEGGTAFSTPFKEARQLPSAGPVSLRFDSAISGEITLPGEAPLRISRFRYSSGGTGNDITPRRGIWAIDSEITGRPGRGMQIDHQGSTLLLTFYGYAADGQGRFWLASGPIINNRFSGTLNPYDGGKAFGGPFTVAQNATPAGTVEITFTGPTTGLITLPGEAPKAISLLPF